MAEIYIIHENSEWVVPLHAAFEELGQEVREWFLDEGLRYLDEAPPHGVFYNRMSASSHTRNHRFGPELTHVYLNWLEGAGRRLVNGTRALYLEISKVAQYTALNAAGIRTPRTVAAVGRDHVLNAAKSFGPGPWILKPNRGGKGLGVQLFHELGAMEAYLNGQGAGEAAPIDGIWLVQDYIRSAESFITRAEFVGGKYLYAVRVDTSKGFELCPADVCEIEDTYCPADAKSSGAKFEVLAGFATTSHGRNLIDRYERFLAANNVKIAGIEFIRDGHGQVYTYDINTNTNYNAEAEAKAGIEITGMRAVARYLISELQKEEVSLNSGVAAE